jgi:hypothetical protein
MKDLIRVSLPLPLFTWLAQVSPILSSLYNSFCLINLPFKRVGEGGSQRRDSEKGKGVGRISSGALRANLGYLSQGRRYPYKVFFFFFFSFLMFFVTYMIPDRVKPAKMSKRNYKYFVLWLDE